MTRAVSLVLLVLAIALCVEARPLGFRRVRHGRLRREDVLQQMGLMETFVNMDIPDQYYSQTLDHFDRQNPARWQQRYWVSTQYFTNPNGPVFLYIEGEGAGSPSDVLFGNHVEMASQMGALLIAVEHRYYGLSVPVADLSVPNMRWLSSQQALADLAEFHAFATTSFNLTEKNTWICFGGSYPGALSAWFRLKYPHLVYGAVASSAPVQAQNNFEGYNDVIGWSLADPIVGGSNTCVSNVQAAFNKLNGLLQTPAGRAQLDTLFQTQPSLANASPDDVYTFVSNVAGVIQGVVQYNNEVPGLNISGICNYMLQGTDPLAQLALVALNDGPVQTSWSASLVQLNSTDKNAYSSGVGLRQWTYQTCTEFGYYQTCDSNTTCPFMSPIIDLDHSLRICQEIFGTNPASVQTQVDFSNDYYGANHPGGERIIFVNGKIDPWHYLSVLDDVPGSSQSAIFIQGTAHCANMESTSPSDPPQLTMARALVSSQVKAWIAQNA